MPGDGASGAIAGALGLGGLLKTLQILLEGLLNALMSSLGPLWTPESPQTLENKLYNPPKFIPSSMPPDHESVHEAYLTKMCLWGEPPKLN